MDNKEYLSKASEYLNRICSVNPNRRTGSQGNKDATAYFAETIRNFGYSVDTTPFGCLDYKVDQVSLALGEKESVKRFTVYNSPYSLGCDITAELTAASTVDELENICCKNTILLLNDELCSEQLMPKNFVFYNPDHHKRIISLLEQKKPSAIITATSHKPELVGALYPFPLIADGDFNIPSVYCTDIVGKEIAEHIGQMFTLNIQAVRISSTANNVVAVKNENNEEKVVVCAHIDTYEDTPGASDNASGTVILLLLAEMLQDYNKSLCIELAAFNGEDHYSAGGQMDYLKRYGSEIQNILFTINMDGVGYKEGKTAYSFYECSGEFQQRLCSTFKKYQGLIEGEPWYNGDHMIFVQKGKPALAFTSERINELMAEVTHTKKDTPDIIDVSMLVEIAEALKDVITSL